MGRVAMGKVALELKDREALRRRHLRKGDPKAATHQRKVSIGPDQVRRMCRDFLVNMPLETGHRIPTHRFAETLKL